MTQCPDYLLQAARDAMTHAYAPYSHFKVGAACQTTDGVIYSGCNIENVSYGLTNCAERTALFSAVSAGKTKFTDLVVVANTEKPISPCGACRQVLSEFFDNQTAIWLVSQDTVITRTTIAQLLPSAFTCLH